LRWAALLPLALLLAGCALTAWWWLQAPGWQPLAGLAAWCIYAVIAWRRRVTATGVLTWDGSGWYWWPDGDDSDPVAGQRPVQTDLALDLQGLMLLRVQPRGPAPGRPADAPPGDPTVWLWLTPVDDPGRWLDLRRALYFRAGREPG
jgi:hypothetical protein